MISLSSSKNVTVFEESSGLLISFSLCAILKSPAMITLSSLCFSAKLSNLLKNSNLASLLALEPVPVGAYI